MSRAQTEQRIAWTLVALLMLAAFAWRVWGLSAADLTEDEELSTGLPLLSYGALFSDIAGRPPLAFLLQKFVTGLAGSADAFWLRFTSLLEGVLAIPVLYLLSRRFGVRPALMASALLASSHFHTLYSRDARYYPLLMLVCLVALLGYWMALAEGRKRGIPLLAAGAIAAPLTHYAGFLFLAALLPPTLLFLLLPSTRRWVRDHTRGTLGIAGGLLAAGLVAAYVLRDYYTNVTNHLKWPDFTEPLPPLFDVTPDFLLHRFDDVSGFGTPWIYVVIILCAIGWLASYRWHPVWPVLFGSILVVPFLLYWLFPPEHPWHAKYFIFQLPALWITGALGVETLAEVIRVELCRMSVPKRVSAGIAQAAVVATVIAAAAPNIARAAEDYAYPDTAQQDLGADLSAWSDPEDLYITTWQGQGRILRHHFPPIGSPDLHNTIRPDAELQLKVRRLPHEWYLMAGKLDAPPHAAKEILSPRFSRVVHDEVFLARAPSLQSITFGYNTEGGPKRDDQRWIAAGESHAMELLVPRNGERMLLVEAGTGAKEECVSLSAHVGGEPVGTLPCLSVGEFRLEPMGIADLRRGLTSLVFDNPSSSMANLRAVHLVPLLPSIGIEALLIPAWDFLELTGDMLSTVWVEDRKGDLMLRDMRHGQAAQYMFYSDYEGRAVVEIAALNDPPFANTYQLLMPGTDLEYFLVKFARGDGTVSRQRSPVIQLQRGLYTLSVGYIGVATDDFMLATRNGRARTQETLQNPGLQEVAIIPVP